MQVRIRTAGPLEGYIAIFAANGQQQVSLYNECFLDVSVLAAYLDSVNKNLRPVQAPSKN